MPQKHNNYNVQHKTLFGETPAHKYTDYTQFTHSNNKQRLEAEEDSSAAWKTWQVYCFGKRK